MNPELEYTQKGGPKFATDLPAMGVFALFSPPSAAFSCPF
jgi:hypothetical protein